MCKDITNPSDFQSETLFSLPTLLCGKKVKVDFNTPDLSSNGGLLLVDSCSCSFWDKMAQSIPDHRNPFFIVHSHQDMIRQRVGQIICGHEDANDCDSLRHDSALKMMTGRLPADNAICPQPSMTQGNRNKYLKHCFFMNLHYKKTFSDAIVNGKKHIQSDIVLLVLEPF